METVLIIVAMLLGTSFSAKLPNDWQTCKGSKDLSNCLKSAIQDVFPKLKNGSKSLGLLGLEPLTVPSVTIGQGTGPVNVEQKFKNFQIHGMSSAKILDVVANLTNEGIMLNLDTITPQAKIVADYELNGRVLLLPVVGKGKCQITLDDVKSQINFIAEKVQHKGVDYLTVTSSKQRLEPTKMTFNFENLFNGDARLGSEINKLLNDNWKVVFEDVRLGYEEVFNTIIADYANKVFSKLPYEEII